jgi:hypothetical protein
MLRAYIVQYLTPVHLMALGSSAILVLAQLFGLHLTLRGNLSDHIWRNLGGVCAGVFPDEPRGAYLIEATQETSRLTAFISSAPIHNPSEEVLFYDTSPLKRPTMTHEDDGKDLSDVEEEFQTCLEALERDGREPAVSSSPNRFRRSVDLITRPYVETDRAGIVRRTNKALLSLNMEPTRRVVGTPFLLFIARGDRERFIKGFLTVAGRNGLSLTQLTARVQPDFDDAVWMHFDGHRVEGPHRQLLGVIWLLKAAEPT